MLLLDSEAISALAHGPSARRERVRGLLTVARRQGRTSGTVAAVLAEVVRGRRQDAAIHSGLRRERLTIRPVDTKVAVRAGGLLGAAGVGSELAVDAFLVAAADLERGDVVVATGDPTDMGRLAAHATDVTIVRV
jgi:hypothetical protein